jgi:hypothetical protein
MGGGRSYHSIRLLHVESQAYDFDHMDDSLHIAEPIALARPRGAHRFEAFSPKLARRVMFGFVALRRWVRICIRSPVTNKMPKTNNWLRVSGLRGAGVVKWRGGSVRNWFWLREQQY